MESRQKKEYNLTEEQKQLAADNIALVPYVLAKKFGTRIASDEDYVAEGHIALCIAAATYSHSKGCKFSGYAATVISNRIKLLIRAKRMQKRAQEDENISLYTPIRNTDGEILLIDIQSPGESAEDVFMREDRRRHLRRITARIKEDAPDLVRAKSGTKQRELAAEQGITFQAVGCRIRKSQQKIVQKYRREYEETI